MISAVNILSYVTTANPASALCGRLLTISNETTVFTEHLCGAHRWTLTLNQTLF